LSMKTIMTTLPEIIMQSGEVDGLIIHGTKDTGNDISTLVEKLTNSASDEVSAQNRVDLPTAISLPGKYGVPLFISSFYHQGDSFTTYYQDHGISVFDFPEKAAEAVAVLLKYKRIKERKVITPAALPIPSEDAAKIIKAALTKGQKALDEYDAKKILAAYGIAIVRERLARTEEEAIAAARSIGFPLALKGCSPEILHKTGKGLIHLNLQDEKGTASAFHAIQRTSGSPVPVLVQEMISGSREFLMGMTRFPGFGPVLLFGLGGIFAEVLKDTAFRAAPLSLVEAEEMAYDIRSRKLLEGFRGMPAVDISALAVILQKLSFIAVLHPEIAEMDLNPLIVSDDKPIVVDALMILNVER
jgi:acetate---CoA ligase (ADP-forming)